MRTFDLTKKEAKIFSIIMNIDKTFMLGQTYRVAGGWVRDKLLGIPCDDIDIALDQMTGREFLGYARKYHELFPKTPLGKDYTVGQNIARSKHLETTALTICGEKIDFVNLRAEDYTEESRVPKMTFGEPFSDAQRRDLTINSMFYNINTEEVEDFVGGLDDLKQMLLRCPLEPVQTFLDDPLRILRVLRFFSRYQESTLSPDIIEAMSDPKVHQAYMTKVAFERAGVEIVKLFQGCKPFEALRILYKTGMNKALFAHPEFTRLRPFDIDQKNNYHQFTVQEHSLRVVENYYKILCEKQSEFGFSKNDRALALIASWFHDLGKCDPEIGKPKKNNPEQWGYIGHEFRSADLVDFFLKQLGIGKDDRAFARTIVAQHMLPHTPSWKRKLMGKFRQRTTIEGQDRSDIWRFVIWHAKADDASKLETIDPETQAHYDEKFDKMVAFLEEPPPIKPFIDGRRLIELFPELQARSGFIRFVHERLLDEQNEGAVTTEKEAEAFILEWKAEVVEQFSE